MAIAWVASTTKGTGAPGRASNGSFTPTIPSGWSAGNLGVLTIFLAKGTVTTPSGWTPISGNPFGSGTEKLYVFWRVMVAGDTGQSVTVAGSGTGFATVAQYAFYSGVDATTPVHLIGSANQGTGTAITANGVTTTIGNCYALGIAGAVGIVTQSSETFNSSGTGVSERNDGYYNGTSYRASTAICDKAIAAAGATGGYASTGNTSAAWVALVIALAPPTIDADGASAGSSEVSGVGSALFSGDGASAGEGAASAISSALVSSEGSASGAGDASGVSAPIADSEGSASGAGDASGVSQVIADSVGRSGELVAVYVWERTA